MGIALLDESLWVDVFYESTDSGFEDNVCIRMIEDCPDEEKLFITDETNIYITADQARQIAKLLMEAAEHSEQLSTWH